MGTVTRMSPCGRYLAREAGRLAGVSGDRIGQWARRGYIRSSQSSTVPRVYSYQDVAEAMVVHELILRKVPLRSIRQAVSNLRVAYGDWPLTSVELAVGAVRGMDSQVLVRDRGGLWDAGSQGKQGVLDLADLARVAADLRRGGWAARTLLDLEHIEVDPRRLSGRPTIRGRRIAAEEVAETGSTPTGARLLRDDYDLTDAEIEDAVRWWAAVQRFDTAAA